MSSLSSAAAPPRGGRQPLRFAQIGDELLARHAARGSERAFAALYERYHQPLYRYCRSILRNDPDAQDALQSTFAGALQALKRDHRDAPLRPWLYRIAHNEAITVLRRRNRDAADELDPESVGVGSSAEQQAADRARWRGLIADLGSLPDRQRGALLLRELSGLSHEEIAIALGTSTAGAKQAIFEARQALAELEEGRAMSCEEAQRRISEGDRRVLRGRRVNAHLHDCAACEAFSLAIGERRTQLRAMTPALPPALAAAVLARSLHAASTQGAAAGGTSTAAAAGVGAAGKLAGTALVWKTVAGVALVATTAAGATGIGHLLSTHHAAARPPVGAPAASHATAPSSIAVRRAAIKPAGAGTAPVADTASSASRVHRVATRQAARGPQSHHATGVRHGAAQGSSTHAHGQGHTRASQGHSAGAPGHASQLVGHSSSLTHGARGQSTSSHTGHQSAGHVGRVRKASSRQVHVHRTAVAAHRHVATAPAPAHAQPAPASSAAHAHSK
jgi:RNA polymerase sigma factor (sigma-70 family)